jgi:hypothetical protein
VETLVRLHLEKWADINADDRIGRVALHSDGTRRRQAIVRLLLGKEEMALRQAALGCKAAM